MELLTLPHHFLKRMNEVVLYMAEGFFRDEAAGEERVNTTGLSYSNVFNGAQGYCPIKQSLGTFRLEFYSHFTDREIKTENSTK